MAGRIFAYGDQEWQDPGQEFTVDEVKKQLTTFYPELARAETTETELDDGTVRIEFVKRAGTKGRPPDNPSASEVGIGTGVVPCPWCGTRFSVESAFEARGIRPHLDRPQTIESECPHCGGRLALGCYLVDVYDATALDV